MDSIKRNLISISGNLKQANKDLRQIPYTSSSQYEAIDEIARLINISRGIVNASIINIESKEGL